MENSIVGPVDIVTDKFQSTMTIQKKEQENQDLCDRSVYFMLCMF